MEIQNKEEEVDEVDQVNNRWQHFVNLQQDDSALTAVNHSEILYCHCDCCAGIFQICRAHQNQLKWVDFRPCFIKMAKWQSQYFSPIIILLLQYSHVPEIRELGTADVRWNVFTKCGEPWIWNLLSVFLCNMQDVICWFFSQIQY